MNDDYKNVLIILSSLTSVFAVVVGFASAFAGSQSDVSPSEQAVCLWAGLGLLICGLAAFPFAKYRFHVPTLFGLMAAQILLFTFILIWGP